MTALEEFVLNLQEFLISVNQKDHNVIRKHTKRINELGDVSFPLNISNWYQYIGVELKKDVITSIFQYKYPQLDSQSVVNQLIEKSLQWTIGIKAITFKNSDVHLYLNRSSTLYQYVITNVLHLNNKYGSCSIINNKVHLETKPNIENINLNEIDLSTFRLILLKDVATNLINFTTSDSAKYVHSIQFVTNHREDGCKNILCGPIINEKGVKSSFTAQELYQKRSSDMRMMAQHKYGVQIKPNSAWDDYFEKLGKGSVTIEMLTNKPQKSIKISLNDLQSANKGASFIFYNCARLAALFKEFDKRISTKEYPELPNVENIDFSLLSQSEEWELFYVYILQFPMVVKSCIKDIEKGIFNPQYLISFLSNLSSIFSVYYRRVRILTNPKEHMFSIIHARIYLLKALQCVFHNSLNFLNIEPIKEM
ncbi:unnamed protein product [Psylliodes chrysocephalus]|uniref:DALR anticodon binding domain-containing protein n=1 Tax=Psylliodes chrysocephalus TaxID=3402493 RepID=A0A9P0D578_9CUCU|nr:unnamed protein product [Psylliodes chrysocephala]